MADVLIETPAVVEAELLKTNGFIGTLAADFDAAVDRVSPELGDAWRRFVAEWQEFYGSGPSLSGIGGPSTVWGANAQLAREYLTRADWFRLALVKAGANVSGPGADDTRGEDPGPSLNDIVYMGFGVIALAVLIVAWNRSR